LKSKTGSRENDDLSLTDSSASTVSSKSGNGYESGDTEVPLKSLPKTKQTLPQNKTPPRTKNAEKDLSTDSDSDDNIIMASSQGSDKEAKSGATKPSDTASIATSSTPSTFPQTKISSKTKEPEKYLLTNLTSDDDTSMARSQGTNTDSTTTSYMHTTFHDDDSSKQGATKSTDTASTATSSTSSTSSQSPYLSRQVIVKTTNKNLADARSCDYLTDS
jgi:hypothetical protein